MTRIELLNRLIAKNNVKNYLEIGINRGKCLFNIKGAKKRFAVDPVFNFSIIKKWRFILKNPDNLKNVFFNMPSDEFFKTQTSLLKNNPVDLAFIDGLHTYDQSLRDTLNTLKYLTPEGIIVLHDCNPLDEIAAYPAENVNDAKTQFSTHKDWRNVWNGDVWKTIVYLRKNHPELTVYVLDTDHGLGVVLNKPSQKPLPEIFNLVENIAELPYSFLEENRKELLDLRTNLVVE